jgi:hypothetical protein
MTCTLKEGGREEGRKGGKEEGSIYIISET